MSGDTEIIPSSGQGSETAPLDSNAETEIVNPASDGDDSNESSSQRNRTKVSTSQANVVHVDKVIINKKLKDRLSRVMESVPRVIPDNEPAEVEHQAATGEALGPSVFIQAKTNATALQDAAGPSKVWDYSGPPFNLGFDSESQEKDEMANSQPQEAHVHVQAQPEEVQQDQDVHVPPHSQLARNKERPYENVGQDFLVKKSGPREYYNETCKKSFTLSNGILPFRNADHLIFPIYHKGHWFVFIAAIRDGYFVFLDSVYGEDDPYQRQVRSVIIPNFIWAWKEYIAFDCDFEDFVTHYAPVPKEKNDLWTMNDNGIFVMKFLELWDPYADMNSRFQAANVNEARIKYVREMVFTPHNRLNSAKDLLDNHIAMVTSTEEESSDDFKIFCEIDLS
nr:unnamed protein product [Digitaria exilis]